MAFTVFTSGTVANADEVMDNFYHVSDGDRLPRGGVSLTSADSTYDIGSSTKKWNNIYCYNFISGVIIGDVWQLLTTVTLSATAASIEVSGLNGDNVDQYMVVSYLSSCTITSYSEIIVNGDSASAYAVASYGISYSDAGSATANRTGDSVGRILVEFSGIQPKQIYTKLVFNPKVGKDRIGSLEQAGFTTTGYASCYRYGGFYYSNSSSTITSMKFLLYDTDSASLINLNPGSKISVWYK